MIVGGRIVFVVGLMATVPRMLPGQGAGQAAPRARTAYEDLQMFSQVLNQIRVNHADSVDMHELFMAAVEGMVRAADPHSYVLLARHDASARERKLREGSFQPVPIQFEYVGGAPLVASVAPGTEAARADIVAGDELVAIDGVPVASEDADQLNVELAGPRGSTTVLRFIRRRTDGSSGPVERKIKREPVGEASAVAAPFMLDATTGYVRVTSFLNERVSDDLRSAMGRLENLGMKRLVLDLRDNPGGLVSEAASVAGEFLPAGTVVYTTEGRRTGVNDTARVKRSFWKKEKRYPMVVLVNNGTASAAELLAGALQDHDRALLVGEPTFGKSLIMQPFPLTDGSVIMLVIGRFRTPCGRLVQRRYREITTREYYRTAGVVGDTAALPTCHTDAGRTVHGGGGVFPDLAVRKPAPDAVWVARLYDNELPLRWSGAYIAEHRSGMPPLEKFETEPRLPSDPVPEFRSFATAQGVEIPVSAEADATLRGLLVGQVAWAVFGQEGFYRVAARHDSQVQAAIAAFDKAESILK